MSAEVDFHYAELARSRVGGTPAASGLTALEELVGAARECFVIHRVEKHQELEEISAYETTEIAKQRSRYSEATSSKFAESGAESPSPYSRA